MLKRKPEFLAKAMDLYKVQKPDSYNLPETVLMREAYLDFYSKSLKAVMGSGAKGDKPSVVFSKRIQVEQKTHNEMLKQLMMTEPATH